jgi:hypothetical protein
MREQIYCRHCGNYLIIESVKGNFTGMSNRRCPVCKGIYGPLEGFRTVAIWVRGKPSVDILIKKWSELCCLTKRMRDAGQEVSEELDDAILILIRLMEKAIDKKREEDDESI